MSNLAAALRSSPDKTNGAKLSRLIIDGGRLALQNVFDTIRRPSTLQAFLNKHYGTLHGLGKILNKTQWALLYPPGGAPPNSSDFDITLLFVLLRNICGLHPPASGWNNKPPPTDTSREANLARIKWFRNELYGHVTTTGVDAHSFSNHWMELSDTLVQLGLDQSEIDRLKSAPLDENCYLDLLCRWKVQEDDIKERVENVRTKVESVDAKVDDVGTKVENVDAKVENVDAKVENVGTKVDDVGTKLENVDAKLDALLSKVGKCIWIANSRQNALHKDVNHPCTSVGV